MTKGFEDWTIEDVQKHNQRIHHFPDVGKMVERVVVTDKTIKNKYNNHKVEADGIKFDSQKEADYYCELKLRLAAGEIKGFCRQAEFILAPNLRYKADFIVFNNDDTSEIIDVKGFKTDVYKAKKKVFEDKFNLKIIEK